MKQQKSSFVAVSVMTAALTAVVFGSISALAQQAALRPSPLDDDGTSAALPRTPSVWLTLTRDAVCSGRPVPTRSSRSWFFPTAQH